MEGGSPKMFGGSKRGCSLVGVVNIGKGEGYSLEVANEWVGWDYRGMAGRRGGGNLGGGKSVSSSIFTRNQSSANSHRNDESPKSISGVNP